MKLKQFQFSVQELYHKVGGKSKINIGERVKFTKNNQRTSLIPFALEVIFHIPTSNFPTMSELPDIVLKIFG